MYCLIDLRYCLWYILYSVVILSNIYQNYISDNFNAYGSCRPPPPEVWELRFEILGLTFEVWDFAVWDLNTCEGVEVGILRVRFEVGDLGFEVWGFKSGFGLVLQAGVVWLGCSIQDARFRSWPEDPGDWALFLLLKTRHCIGGSLAIFFLCQFGPSLWLAKFAQN